MTYHCVYGFSTHVALVFVFQDKLETFNRLLAEKRSERLAERRAQRKEERRNKAIQAREERKQRERDEAIRKGNSTTSLTVSSCVKLC